MALGFDGGETSEHCRFCRASTPPEGLTTLSVPYLRHPPFRVCLRCRADYLSGGWRLQPFDPGVEFSGHYLWPEATLADAEAASGELRAGFEAYREARARLLRLSLEEEPVRARLAAADPKRPLEQLWLRDPALAELAFGIDRELETLLVSAWEAFDEFLPSYTLSTALHARAAAVLATLTLELGERAPRCYGPRKKGPAAWLKDLSDQARNQPALRDPRVPLVRALLFREEDNVAAADRELREARRWLEALDDPEPWGDVAFAIHYDLQVRARDERRWEDVREHLKACSALRPDASEVFFRLAHAYLACARPDVAREILAAKLGASRVKDAEVADTIARLLGELRPQLEQRRSAYPDEPLRVLYGACLNGLGESDAAWRALDGPELLDALEWDGAERDLAQRLHLAGRVAFARGDAASSLRLLEGARGASPAGRARGRVVNDLLCVLHEELREVLDALEEETGAEDPPLEAIHERLDAVHSRVRSQAPALLAATTDHERDVFARFLGRELGDWFRPLVTPPSVSDRDDVRVQDLRWRTDLTYLALSKRRLPDAILQDRAAEEVTGHRTPIHLLLTYLEVVRRGGSLAHAVASRAWATLPTRRAPFEVGLLAVPEQALSAQDVAPLVDLFVDPGRGETVGRQSLRSLRDRCQLILPREGTARELIRDPEVRGFVAALFAACPAFPYVLDMSPERDQFLLFFGSLASPDAFLDKPPWLNLLDASVIDPVERALSAMREVASEAGGDPDAACASLLSHYPPEWRPRPG